MHCIIKHISAYTTATRLNKLIPTKTGSFTQAHNEGTGDRRLLVRNTHQGGCNHATKYKYQYSRFFSELLLIQK